MILQALNHGPTACLRAFQGEQHVNRCGTAEIHVRNADGKNSEILQQQSCGTTQKMFLWNVFVFIYKISDINSWRFKRNILTFAEMLPVAPTPHRVAYFQSRCFTYNSTLMVDTQWD